MQNIDFYEGKNIRKTHPQSNWQDPEYFSRLSEHTSRESERNRKRASRMIFFISALCIISFTAGIGIGIKFAGGADREIVDKKTFNIVTNIGKKVSNLVKEQPSEKTPRKTLFPKKDYPFVIKVDRTYDHSLSKKTANFLSKKGHTVILSKYGNRYRIYIGPYKTENHAAKSLKKISGYKKYFLSSNVKIIKR